MLKSLKILYSHHGGIKSIFLSIYAWLALLLTVISSSSIEPATWVDPMATVLPSLTGFSIACFAIIFVVLDPESVKKLLPPNDSGQSPLVKVASTIGHMIVIQVLSLLFLLLIQTSEAKNPILFILDVIKHNFKSNLDPLQIIEYFYFSFSSFSLFLCWYAVCLVIAAILSIIRMQAIVAGVDQG